MLSAALSTRVASSGRKHAIFPAEPKRDIGLVLPTGRDFPLPSCSAGVMGVAVFGRLRPYRFGHCWDLAGLGPGRLGPGRAEPVPSITRWAAEFAEPQRRGEQRNIMARKHSTSQSNGNGHTVSEDIADIEREIGELMHDIEARVGRLNALAKRSAREAADDASEFVSDAVSGAADRMRNGASS